MAKKDNRFPRPILPLDIWGPVPDNQDPTDNEKSNELDDEFKRSTIHRNQLESERTQLEINRLKRQEELDRERWRNSPEGRQYAKEMNQKYDDKRFYIRDKSLNFLFYRPIALLKDRHANGITYKNYLSIIYWVLVVGFYSYFFGFTGFIGGAIIAMALILVFYLIRFEIGWK